MGIYNTDNMGVSTTRHKQFFMTRQIATILEDLDRQVSLPDSISLLYGINGCGKSCLLQQFISTRIQNVPRISLLFGADGTYSYNDRQYSQLDFTDNILTSLDRESVVILDQLEYAFADILDEVLRRWSDVGRHHSKLILCGSPQVKTDLSRLSPQFECRINTVELKPLSESDRLEYMMALICPSPGTDADLSPVIKKLIRQSDGTFSSLNRLYTRCSEDIDCNPNKSIPSAIGTRYFLSLAFGIALFCLVYVIYSSSQNDVGDIKVSQTYLQQPVLASNQQTALGARKPQDEFDQVEGSQPPHSSAILTDSISGVESKSSAVEALSETLSEKPEVKDKPDGSGPEYSLLQQRIRATEEWLDEADGRRVTIQVMTLRLRDDTFKSLSQYLDRLRNIGVELKNIYIYSALKRNFQIYGVLYGSYSTRQQARDRLATFPPMLKSDRPILRTVRGIKQEINNNGPL